MIYKEELEQMSDQQLLGEFLDTERMAKTYSDLAEKQKRLKEMAASEIKKRNLHNGTGHSGALYDIGFGRPVFVGMVSGFLRVEKRDIKKL